jgi:hypothetical protein
MAKKKAAHGGARPGSGRPLADPEGKAVIITASVPGGLVERLAKLAEEEGWSRSKAVTEAVRLLLARKKR